MASDVQTTRPGEEELSALTDLVIITGFSGAGKSTAMAAFEDEGYFCVDNLPSETIRSLVDLFMHAASKVARAAVVPDVRFLPNPHYEPQLRPLTGEDARIVAFINRDGELDAFYDQLDPFLDYLLPQYLAEGKAHLVVAIGCTGGRHRSVAIALHLAERYRNGTGYLVDALHRDVTRPA